MELVELHCHLDASVRPATIMDLARDTGVPAGVATAWANSVPQSCTSLIDYMAHIDRILPLLQTEDSLVRVAREFAGDLLAEGVSRAEVRFAPQQHTAAGLTNRQVVQAVRHGLDQGRAGGQIQFGLVLCCLRQEDPAQGMRLLEETADLPSVVALDLAGDEANYAGARYAHVFAAAREAGLRSTVHAGEAAGPERIFEALDVLGAERIGHGVAAGDSRALMERLRADHVPLEMCPTSNVITGAVASLELHPAGRYLSQGLAVTINTDGRTTTGTSLIEEYRRVARSRAWPANGEERARTHGAAATFVASPS